MRAAELVPLQQRLPAPRRRQRVARVQRRVAEEFVRRSVHDARARLQHHVHLRAGAAAVFGVVGVLQQRQLLDRVEARIDDEAIEELVVVVDAVEQEVVRRFARAAAVDAGVALGREPRARAPAAPCRRAWTGELERFALGHRQRHQRLGPRTPHPPRCCRSAASSHPR